MAAPAVRDTRSRTPNLTLGAVATRSGNATGGLRYHFRTKEELAAVMIERAMA